VFLRLVPEYRVTHAILVPTMLRMVFNHPECGTHDVSSIVAITCGGSPVTRDLVLRAREVFGPVLYPMYGLAETYSCALVLPPHQQHTEGTEAQVRRLGSAGKPMVLNSVRVVGKDGNDVPQDNATAGEVWIAGDTVSSEYFRRPEETAASRTGEWFHSGDLAVIDEEGFITIVDRLKDVIITGGINVFSGEVEEAVRAHPAVAEAAVIGVPHDTWGEAIHAVVVVRDGAEVTEEEVIETASSRLAGYKKPRSVSFVDALPMSATGKVLKRQLRLPYWAGRERVI
jgi:long-chain acyl-CoA synthetase